MYVYIYIYPHKVPADFQAVLGNVQAILGILFGTFSGDFRQFQAISGNFRIFRVILGDFGVGQTPPPRKEVFINKNVGPFQVISGNF